jgi:hypothetical protein
LTLATRSATGVPDGSWVLRSAVGSEVLLMAPL